MTKLDYFKYSLHGTEMYKLNWYISFLGIVKEDTEYLKIDKKSISVLVNGNYVKLDDVSELPVYHHRDKITLDIGDLPNVKSKIETTYGRAITNKLLLVYPFGDKVEYLNTRCTLDDIESKIGKLMVDDVITVPEYLRYTDVTQFLNGFSMLLHVSATYKNITPPKGINEFKKEVIARYDKEYGPKWRTDRLLITQMQDELSKYQKDYLKDDPSYGKMLKGQKILGNGMIKMYVTYGKEDGMQSDGSKTQLLEGSLLDQYPDDPTLLASAINGLRNGSYARGAMTQQGGALTKDILRALSSYTVAGDDDCGTTIGRTITITDENVKSIENRYLMDGTLIDNPKQYLGKTITIRSPLYCKNKNNSYCGICVGKVLRNYKYGIAGLGVNITSAIMLSSMKAMHNTQVSLLNLDMSKVLF